MKQKKKVKVNKKKVAAKTIFINVDEFLKAKKYPYKLPASPIAPFNIDNYVYLRELDRVVEKLQSIATRPRTHIIAKKESKSIETAVRIDNSDLRETTQREKLWKQRGMEAMPERVFSDEFDTDLAIYENRFVVSLLEKTFAFINLELRSVYSHVTSISNNYQMSDIYMTSAVDVSSLSNISLPSYYISKTTKRKSFLTCEEVTYSDVIKHLLYIRRNLVHIIASKFYKVVKQAKPLSEKDIHPTNLLLGDPTYAPCYSFYLKLKKMTSVVRRGNRINTTNYCNYVIYTLLKTLKKQKYKFTSKRIKMVKNDLVLSNFKANNDAFKLTINSKLKHIDLTFKLAMKNKTFKKAPDLKLMTLNKVSLDLIPNISTSLSSILIEAITTRRLSKGYNNAFVVTSQALTSSDEVVICNPFIHKLDSNISNMLKALTLITEGDSFIYSHLCPVCGSPITIEEEDGNYVCPVCSSTYSIIPAKTKKTDSFNIVWVKRIKTK